MESSSTSRSTVAPWSTSILRPALEFFKFSLPFALTALVYDSQTYWGSWFQRTIHIEEPYAFDLKYFGISSGDQTLTPNEWWQEHTHTLLDFIAGVHYLTFIAVFVFVTGYFRFWLPRKGTHKRSALYIARRSLLPVWGFFWVNLIGYITYYLYAAAPPWYVTLYGFTPADLATPASAAGAIRFDELIGIPVFQNMYSKSLNVFGAIPSLHVAYPLIAAYYAFRFGRLRAFTTSYYLLMCFSAVYLNHHYLLDLIWGSGYALLVCLSMDAWIRFLQPQTPPLT